MSAIRNRVFKKGSVASILVDATLSEAAKLEKINALLGGKVAAPAIVTKPVIPAKLETKMDSQAAIIAEIERLRAENAALKSGGRTPRTSATATQFTAEVQAHNGREFLNVYFSDAAGNSCKPSDEVLNVCRAVGRFNGKTKAWYGPAGDMVAMLATVGIEIKL